MVVSLLMHCHFLYMYSQWVLWVSVPIPIPVPVQFMCLYLLSARATATCINYCPLTSSSPIKNSLTASSQRPIMSTPDCKGKSSRSHHCFYSVSICSSLSAVAVCNCLSTDRFLLSLLVAFFLSFSLPLESSEVCEETGNYDDCCRTEPNSFVTRDEIFI